MPETALLKIRLFGDAALRRKAEPVKPLTPRHREILSQMAQVMYAHAGVGLAAPQVGINQAMIVADTGSGLYKLINPRVIKREGRQVLEEGCLSIPGVCIKVKRAGKIKVLAEDELGKTVNIEAEDLLSACLQHEIDHLKGKLIVDYASFFEKLKIQKKLQELKKKAKDEGVPRAETKSCPLQL